MADINNRFDFVYLFDVQDGNPNGDPDAGNLPRVDAETGKGLVTDVCLKRKVRNYVEIKNEPLRRIYIKEKAVLGHSHIEAYKALGYELGTECKVVIDGQNFDMLNDMSLCEGLSVEYDEDRCFLIIASDADKKYIKDWIKDNKLPKELAKIINDALKSAKPRKPTKEEIQGGRKWMCENFFDIRSFGAVMSLKSAPNCGQVRGPIQLTFARSIDPIVASEHSITRMAVATEKEAEKQSGDNRTMGRKATVPYGLYRCHGFISANLAKQTGFDEEDLELFWEALKNMFDVDRSAARGLMSAQKLIVFKHDSELGNAPANKLFDRVKVQKKEGVAVPRSFADYDVNIDKDNIPNGVELMELI